jgi:hypothetical protein
MRRLVIPITLVLAAISAGVATDGLAAQPAADMADASTAAPLEVLDWMIGTWIDEGDHSTIVTTCSWTKNRKFLKRSFKVKIDDEVTLEGDQFVGWDPMGNQIRSWTFDSEGGFGDGIWLQDGKRWLVKASFVLADGSRASALSVYTQVDDDTIRWQSTNREIAGELQPNIPEVTVVRQKDEAKEELK